MVLEIREREGKGQTEAGQAMAWIASLQPGLTEVAEVDLRWLRRFEAVLTGLLATYPIGPTVAPTSRSRRLLRIRSELVAADSALVKARRDLNGLLYADGIHDSLYRTVGRMLIGAAPATAIRLPRAHELRLGRHATTSAAGSEHGDRTPGLS